MPPQAPHDGLVGRDGSHSIRYDDVHNRPQFRLPDKDLKVMEQRHFVAVVPRLRFEGARKIAITSAASR